MKHSSRRVGASVAVIMVLAPGAVRATTAASDQEIRSVEIPGYRLHSLSPDGQLLAAYTPESLCVFDVESLAERACTDLDALDVAMSEGDVVWSPDSTRIAFTEQALVRALDGDLWVTDASSGELTNLTDDGYEGRLFGDDLKSADAPVHVDVAPSWSPDGESISVSRTTFVDGEPAGTELVDVDVASSDVDPLTSVSTEPFAVYLPMSWSSDAERLFYSVAHRDPQRRDNGVWEFVRSTGQSRQVLGADPDKGAPYLAEVAATGDVGLIVYPQYYAAGRGVGDAIVLGDLASGDVTSVGGSSTTTDGAAVLRTATFSPDGTEVLFTMRDGDVARLLLGGIPGGKPAEVAASTDWLPAMSAPGIGLDWAVDGTVFGSDGPEAGVLLHIDQPAG